MREIFAQNLDFAIEDLGIAAMKTYQGEDYQVWQLEDLEYQKLFNINDSEWKDNYGMWRSAEGSNMTNELSDFMVNGQSMIGWDGDGRLTALDEVNGDEEHEDYWYRDREYKSLLYYLCDEIGVSQPRNICALAVDLAILNNMTMAQLFEKYES